MNAIRKMKKLGWALTALSLFAGLPHAAFARDITYTGEEISINVTPGEPSQVQFPGPVGGGVKRKASSLSLQPNDDTVVIFASEAINEAGEAIVVRLKDGSSYSVRVRRASESSPRDATARIRDDRSRILSDPTEEPSYVERKFDSASPQLVSGLMREMVLVAEFGKKSIPGYRVSERYRGEPVLNDGTIVATVDKIFMGPNLWGYVLDASNLLDTSQKLNPASFRLDGTRAVSAKNWELAPRPLNAEQRISKDSDSKVYIVTKARRTN
ncbi:MAG: hypothetical protein EBZ48_11420 [Proteobacteria bacterium]|nr:hypothetical protein [Pseudomonadota bacterium]